MKLRLMICAMAASTALFATDVTSATHAVMAVSDTATNTVIGVPWVKTGEGEVSPATIASLVSATSLSAGDVLYVYDDSSTSTWRAYTVQNGEWVASTTISSEGMSSVEADAKTVALGSGMILQRSDPSKTIYLSGRVPTSAGSSAISAGTAEAPVRTLFANASASDVVLSVAGAVGDRIIVPQNGGASTQYEYKDGAWGTYVKQTVTKTIGSRTITSTKDVWTSGCTIPAGKGAWYLSVGGSPTITW